MAKKDCMVPAWAAWLFLVCGIIFLASLVMLFVAPPEGTESERMLCRFGLAIFCGGSLGTAGFGLWERYFEK